MLLATVTCQCRNQFYPSRLLYITVHCRHSCQETVKISAVKKTVNLSSALFMDSLVPYVWIYSIYFTHNHL